LFLCEGKRNFLEEELYFPEWIFVGTLMGLGTGLNASITGSSPENSLRKTRPKPERTMFS
jgi:hypothetical protein